MTVHLCEFLKLLGIHVTVSFSKILCYSFSYDSSSYFLGYVPYAATIIYKNEHIVFNVLSYGRFTTDLDIEGYIIPLRTSSSFMYDAKLICFAGHL